MAKTNKNENDIAKMSFEETITELTSIVAAIEEGDIALQESLGQYERGMKLIKHCRGILEQAEKRIENIGEVGGDEPQSLKLLPRKILLN